MTSVTQKSPTTDELAGHAAAAFEEAFGSPASATAAAPGRVNLIGEHTDYNEGFVLPIAIDRWTVAAGALVDDAADSAICAPGCDLRTGFDPRAARAGLEAGDPALYAAGAVTLALQAAGAMGAVGTARGAGAAGARTGVRIALASSVPVGAGLSSSAAVEVACAMVTLQLLGHAMAPLDVARLCQRAEQEFAGVPCGIMDQYVSVMAQPGSALLIDCRDLCSRAVPLPPAEDAAIIVGDTGVRHELGQSAYGKRREACARVARALGLSSLRDADARALNDLQGQLAACAPAKAGCGLAGGEAGPPVGLWAEDLRRARHVINENQRTLVAAHGLEAGDLRLAGRHMNASHESLRDDYEVSCAELDALVDAARATEGVYGARMTGAGFGGCAIALATPTGAAALEEIWPASFGRRFGRPCRVFRVRAARGAAAVAGV